MVGAVFQCSYHFSRAAHLAEHLERRDRCHPRLCSVRSVGRPEGNGRGKRTPDEPGSGPSSQSRMLGGVVVAAQPSTPVDEDRQADVVRPPDVHAGPLRRRPLAEAHETPAVPDGARSEGEAPVGVAVELRGSHCPTSLGSVTSAKCLALTGGSSPRSCDDTSCPFRLVATAQKHPTAGLEYGVRLPVGGRVLRRGRATGQQSSRGRTARSPTAGGGPFQPYSSAVDLGQTREAVNRIPCGVAGSTHTLKVIRLRIPDPSDNGEQPGNARRGATPISLGRSPRGTERGVRCRRGPHDAGIA